MKFKEYIGIFHPDPDSLLTIKFEEMCKLAEEYAQSLKSKQPDDLKAVCEHPFKNVVITSFKNHCFKCGKDIKQ